MLIKVYDKPKLYNLELKVSIIDILYKFTHFIYYIDIHLLYIFYIFLNMYLHIYFPKYLHFRVN